MIFTNNNVEAVERLEVPYDPDASGELAWRALLRVFERQRVSEIFRAGSALGGLVAKGVLPLVKAQSVAVAPRWRLRYGRGAALELRLAAVGKRTLGLEQRLVGGGKEVLATCSCTLICCAAELVGGSAASVEVPRWFADAVGPLPAPPPPPPWPSPSDTAPAFETAATVRPSDTDTNRHTNHSAYVVFCLDAVAEAAASGALGLDANVAPDVAELRCEYLAETVVGARLRVELRAGDGPAELLAEVGRAGEDWGAPCFRARLRLRHTTARVPARL